jgi:serine/threonine-protein kinase HipA
MAAGKNNHYVIDTIMPRHFVQTAEVAGIPADTIPGILSELVAEAPAALEKVREELPASFPEKIYNSIANGVRRRLRRVGV